MLTQYLQRHADTIPQESDATWHRNRDTLAQDLNRNRHTDKMYPHNRQTEALCAETGTLTQYLQSSDAASHTNENDAVIFDPVFQLAFATLSKYTKLTHMHTQCTFMCAHTHSKPYLYCTGKNCYL